MRKKIFIKGLLPIQSLRLKPRGAFLVGTFGSSVGTYFNLDNGVAK